MNTDNLRVYMRQTGVTSSGLWRQYESPWRTLDSLRPGIDEIRDRCLKLAIRSNPMPQSRPNHAGDGNSCEDHQPVRVPRASLPTAMPRQGSQPSRVLRVTT